MPNATSFVSAVPNIPGPIADTRRPRVKFPAGACDCHAHVFGPQQQYPFATGGGYVPPECSIDDYVRMLRAIGCERAVIVHPSVYGTDNRCTVDALRSGKFPFRGVVVIDVLPPVKQALYQSDTAGCQRNSATNPTQLRCQLGDLQVGETRTFFVVLLVRGSKGIVSNTASVLSPTTDPVPGKNSSTKVVTVGK